MISIFLNVGAIENQYHFGNFPLEIFSEIKTAKKTPHQTKQAKNPTTKA